MANPITVNGTHYRQEVYANAIVELIRPQIQVRSFFATDYEGNPVAGAVNIPVRSADVTIATSYDILNGISLTQSATTYKQILVDKTIACNELVFGYEAAAVPDNLQAQRLESAAYGMASKLETDAVTALVNGGTTESNTDALSTSTVYSTIATSIKEMKKIGISPMDMVIIVSPETELLLLTDEKYSNTSGQLGAEVIRSGVVGRINGVMVIMSSFLPANVDYIVMARPWCQQITAWKILPNFIDIRDGKHIGSSSLQGLQIYTEDITNALAVRIKTNASASI
jgi:hypothetical protein